ncbi:MAG: type I-E CRISPR-associated protein Cas7/Cse4/CasC [Clostridiales bacterium]|nr:type I-E CRISPR-associated protein Cas7/Cse4/CasC [Clostridiales bacterium]
MSNSKMYIDFHVIQTVPPSCVNRDDTGSPKTAVYGGVRRARVSSQSWKRAMREMFRENFDESELGVRTKRIVGLVQSEILKINPEKSDDDALKLAKKVINAAEVKTKDAEAKALFFMSAKQAENLARLALSGQFGKKEAQEALKEGTGVDIALFGRMVAKPVSLSSDASAQVAHAISTHRVDNEYDYFTAVDDMAPEDNAGAGMIGTIEYNSSTLYRYATVAGHSLFEELSKSSEATAKAVKEFARAFITSMPTGKQNTFANRTLPDGVVVSIRADQPINLVGAFEMPIAAKEAGYSKESMVRLISYAEKTYGDYFGEPLHAWVISESLSSLGEAVALPKLLEDLEAKVSAMLSIPQ